MAPTRYAFGCCALAKEPTDKKTVGSKQIKTRTHMVIRFSPVLLLFSADSLRSLYDFVRSRQHVRRNRQTDLLRRFQIDHQLELGRLLHRQIRWFGALYNFVNVGGSAPEQVGT